VVTYGLLYVSRYVCCTSLIVQWAPTAVILGYRMILSMSARCMTFMKNLLVLIEITLFKDLGINFRCTFSIL